MKASPLLLLESVSAESQNMLSVTLSSRIGASSGFADGGDGMQLWDRLYKQS
jgi:hypothetical protein